MKKKKSTVIPCPQCGTNHWINKHVRVKCLCGAELLVMPSGKTKSLMQIGGFPCVEEKEQNI